jgi:hypothetical protein
MLTNLRSRLTYANVMATIAAFLALGGGGIAVASHLTVRSSDIVNGQVKKPDVGEEQVGSSEVLNNALKSEDVKPDSLGGSRIVESSLGTVPNADKFDNLNSTDFAHDIVVTTGQSSTNNDAIKERFLQCPSGRKVVGGGASVVQVDGNGNPVLSSNIDPNLALTASNPIKTGNNQIWYARAVETDSVNANWYLYVTALCAAGE